MVLPPQTKHLQKLALSLTLGQGPSSWKGKRQAGAELRNRTGPQIQADTACGGSGRGPCWSRPSFPLAYFHLSFSASRAFLKQLFRRRLLAAWEGRRVLFFTFPQSKLVLNKTPPFPSPSAASIPREESGCSPPPHAVPGPPILSGLTDIGVLQQAADAGLSLQLLVI